MSQVIDIAENQLMLLSTLDLEEVAEGVAAIISQHTQCKAIGVLIWDSDLECFSDRLLFGPRKKDLGKFAEAVAEQSSELLSLNGKIVGCMDLDEIAVRLPEDLEPVLYFQVQEESSRCALILVAGVPEDEAEGLEAQFRVYPFYRALFNAWEVRELRRDNERLRNGYEEMERKNSILEEQTRKLIHDIQAKESLRTRGVAQEKLAYEISNAVRSSLEIQEVLQTSVNKIGSTFTLGRCILIRPVAGLDELSIFEYHHPEVPAARELFRSEKGQAFLREALHRTAPVDFGDLDWSRQDRFDRSFIDEMGMLSGLLVPLVLRDRTIGAILLQDCQVFRQWTIDDTAFFGSLADQLSVAIENADLHEEKKLQAVTDALTGVSNRRHFNEVFAREFERAKRYGEPLSLVIVDLDYMKKINDNYGHQAGDEAIRAIGTILGQSCRSIDLPARYGGEEFCLLLPNTDIDMAQVIAERLRKLINDTIIEGPGNLSASVGVASFPQHAAEMDNLFQAADSALYKAKEGGRNRVCVAEPMAG